MKLPAYELSAHAAEVLVQRGIERAWLERVLAAPERDEVHAQDCELRHSLGRIVEHGNRYLRVVYNSSVNPIRVVTAYFDRSVKGEQ